MRPTRSAVTCAALAVSLAVPLGAQDAPGLLVSGDWVERHTADPHIAILQAESSRGRYDEAHVPGARFLDMSLVVWDGDPAWGTEMTSPGQVREALERAGVSEGQHIVVYSSNPLAASRAFLTLEAMGLRGSVSMLDGGMTSWLAEGRPLSTDDPMPVRGRIMLRPTGDVVVSADWVHEHLDDAHLALVDARPDDEYTGADGGMGGRAHPGHIPGAAQLYWERLIRSRRDPTLVVERELRDLFAEAGADPGDTVVTYCMVGARASFDYFVARLLGYDVKFYDGSWMEWGTRDDLPYVSGRSRR